MKILKLLLSLNLVLRNSARAIPRGHHAQRLDMISFSLDGGAVFPGALHVEKDTLVNGKLSAKSAETDTFDGPVHL